MQWFQRWWNRRVLSWRGICPKHLIDRVTSGACDVSWTYCPECEREERTRVDGILADIRADSDKRIELLRRHNG